MAYFTIYTLKIKFNKIFDIFDYFTNNRASLLTETHIIVQEMMMESSNSHCKSYCYHTIKFHKNKSQHLFLETGPHPVAKGSKKILVGSYSVGKYYLRCKPTLI